MAITVKPGSRGPASVLAWRNIDVTLDNNYPSGGYALGASNFGFSVLHAVIPMPTAAGYTTEYNVGTGKLLVYRVNTTSAPHAEPTGVDVSAVVVRVFGIGEL